MRRRLQAGDDSGSAISEFVMVSALLTVLTLSVLQLAIALLVRNTVLDAAAEGARYASLADNTPADGVARTADLIATAIGPRYAENVTASFGSYLGHPAVIVSVQAPLPVVGLLGIEGGLEVFGHAAIERLG
ncbi:MAG: TadE/TadG family type IV pilus assembly protein [Rhodoglobus sp.]|nr:TadE/TadG family type IV pilus assembly protein [Rhodoglobus sp.]